MELYVGNFMYICNLNQTNDDVAMKRILFFLFCAVMLFSCRHQQKEIVIIPDIEKNHLQRTHLFGQVKEVKTESFVLFADSTGEFSEGDVNSILIQKFSSDGYMTSVVRLSGNGDTVSNELITYSDDAKELSHEIYGSDSILKAKRVFEYNRYGFKSKEMFYRLDSLLYSIDYKTDDKGNVVEMTNNRDGMALHNRVAYNKAGLVARIDEYEPSGKLFKYATIEYDNYGDEVNRRVFKAGGELVEYTYTEYNQQGWLVKVIYEDRLHQIREVSEYSEYDEAGNWTKESNSTNNRPTYCRKRHITYY